uniref:Uncharacterized protein n=1 Tax=Romanomermis culicivorax TaxID=13658 RepID=A0A915KN32_ROMCU
MLYCRLRKSESLRVCNLHSKYIYSTHLTMKRINDKSQILWMYSFDDLLNNVITILISNAF